MLASLLITACATVVVGQRSESSFSYAWRFHYGTGGDDAAPGPGNNWLAAFDTPISNCSETFPPSSTVFPDPHRMTDVDCETSCAYDPNCLAWIHVNNSRACTHATAGASCAPSSPANANGAIRVAATPLQTAYSYAATNLPEADTWPLVSAPHDALMSLDGSFSPDGGDERHGYRLRTVAWYRKAFALPAEWSGSGPTFLRFEGVMHYSQLWLNGVYLGLHSSSYGAFTVRLDNVSGVVFGGGRNVLALRADASAGSEHWYGGGGLMRNVQLVHTGAIAFVEDGVWVPPELPVSTNTVTASAEWESFSAAPTTASVRFDVRDTSGALIATATTTAGAAPPANGGTLITTAALVLPPSLALWSAAAPTLYVVTASLLASDGATVDERNVTVGFRRTQWDANTGFSLNGESFKQRGFSHHNSFAGVGVAMVPRLDLFRAQVSRTLGANIWRMSHNPYRTALYDTLDVLGTLVWEENRDMGPAYVHEMHDMVKRARNHPSIVVLSLCNEVECIAPLSVGAAMVSISKALDPTRLTTANSNGEDNLNVVIDIQGFSHAPAAKFAAAHAARPSQPLVLSECCSCDSQRLPRKEGAYGWTCMQTQNAPGEIDYVAGSLGVWTLFDYFGEPPGPWPYVSSSFGQLDLAGFVKPHAYWYTSNWRELTPSGASKVAIATSPVARVLDLLDSSPSKTLSGTTSAASAELVVDGISQGVQTGGGVLNQWVVKAAAPCSWPVNQTGVQCKELTAVPSAQSAAACEAAACARGAAVWQWALSPGCWVGMTPVTGQCPAPHNPSNSWVGASRDAPPPPPLFRNATLIARDAGGAIVATHTVRAPVGPAVAVLLTLDVPSQSTGTGSRLLLDGSDVALIRATLVDAHGTLISSTPTNITFGVLSGPAYFTGIGSGDPASHEQPHGNVVATYGGLARAFATVSYDCVSPNRALIRTTDLDGHAAIPTVKLPGEVCPTDDVVIYADVEGFPRVTISIPVSVDVAADGVAAAARAAFATGAEAYLASFEG